MADILNIDGSVGEGGGAILRLSAAFSFLFNRPIRIYNIRANRPKPGLRTQHLLGLQTLSKLTNSQLSECKVGSQEISFIPNRQITDKLELNINTAASIGLLLQPLQVASLNFPKGNAIKIDMNGGGTYGKWAPSLAYLQEVSYRVFERAGLNIDLTIQKHGFYPKGGAKTKCLIRPPRDPLKPLILTELGNITSIQGKIVITKRLKKDIASRISNSIKNALKRLIGGVEANINIEWVESASDGVGLDLWAESDSGAIISTGTLLGEKGLSSEKLAQLAAKELFKYIQNDIPVDNYLSDQLVPLMAYVNQTSKIKVLELTSHTKTNLELVNLFIHKSYSINKEKKGYIIEFT